jgi:hypothetical protein
MGSNFKAARCSGSWAVFLLARMATGLHLATFNVIFQAL